MKLRLPQRSSYQYSDQPIQHLRVIANSGLATPLAGPGSKKNLGVLIACLVLSALFESPANSWSADPAIQDVPKLLLEVEAHQKQVEKIREDYTYRELMRTEELDGRGNVKKTETEELEVFYINSHPIRRLVRKEGKELSEDQQKKEATRISKEVEHALAKPPGQPLRGDAISVQRLLEIMAIRNPRRMIYKNRATLAFDFTGDPHTKTHGITEDISKKLSGTVWIDVKDRQVARMDARIDDNFRMGGGLVASVEKGSNFTFEQGLVNQELWLPSAADVLIAARVMLVKGLRQHIHVENDNYQKFHADAFQQPGITLASPSKP